MSKFLVVAFTVLMVCSIVAGAMSLIEGRGWEQAMGFCMFAGLFFGASDYFRNQ